MSGKKNVRVTREKPTGRNERFLDPDKGREMSRTEFADRIDNGEYSGYHVRDINNKRTPVSNPDKSEGNNLD